MEIFVFLIVVIVVALLMMVWGIYSSDRNVKKIKEATSNAVYRISNQLSDIGFSTTREIAVDYFCEINNSPIKSIRIDSLSRRVAICDYDKIVFRCYYFSEILGCELAENHEVIHKSGLGRAVIGGIIAGGVGAIVGASSSRDKEYINSLALRIITADVNNPQIILETLSTKWRNDDKLYQPILNHAREIYAIFNSIILSNNSN